MKQNIKSTSYILLAAIIWGSTFVAQRKGMDYITPFYFSALRSVAGSAMLLLIYYISSKKASLSYKPSEEEKKRERSILIKGVLVCGTLVFLAMNMLQTALVTIDAGKAGFTAMYIILVPLFSIFFKQKTTLFTWIGTSLGVVGLYFLSFSSGVSIEFGDLIVLVSSVFWAFHILATNYFAPKLNVIKLISGQFCVVAIFSFIAAFIFEPLPTAKIVNAIGPILYAGIMSTGIGFTLQALGQKTSNPTTASLVMSTESIWAMVFGMLLLGEMFTSREFFGCILMFIAIIFSQVPMPKRKNRLQ